MNKVINSLRQRAKSESKKIVFPEPEDERVKEAVAYIKKEAIAQPVLLTPNCFDPKLQEDFAVCFFERKKAKGITIEQAREKMNNPLYYGAMLVRHGHADGFVAGAKFTTSSVLRAALGCLEIDKKSAMLSSCFLMAVPDCVYGEDGVFVYADCAAVPYPTSTQLANIAISAAHFSRDILNIEPRVAMLSFSTRGSSSSRWVEKIKEAVEIANSKDSGFLIEGELQADAALVPKVAERKIKGSKVAGRANVLIFPSLDAGNICYKLIQRLAKARAVGPIILGTVQPCSDLSRGCEVEDVIDCAVVTAVRAQKKVQQAEANFS